MSQAIAAYVHYLAIFALFALLSIEHILFKLPLDLPRARSLVITDRAYGICAVLVLLSGAARVLWFGKGSTYYLHNSLFHAKVGLFVLVALLSIGPTVRFISWGSALKAGVVPAVSERQGQWLTWAIRLELLLLILIPLCAVLFARGYGNAS
ncbi:DUF2214 family protein [Pseudomonas sp. 5P_3.1_Bac2]|uniref:DUF2214 family protein n=1 Tax=Pseudomonas sp. 5P_3.1_Bac2 TaxID=2971617 RepID=UPI0021C64C1D|nr:DUF2214 family protein [Pseudomonas sp. 5P_3.1_Bac2]MCU1719363.1 DUF2214 family protein [Pseudomonas sp. 5P_3.1_Bac2]